MPHLVAAVVVVGVLCVFNLLLTYGVIRRLREHTKLLSYRPAGLPDIIVGAGSMVGAFSASTIDGDLLSVDDLATGTMVGFFSPGCSACGEQLPKFVDAAAAHPCGQGHVLAVVIGSEDDAKEYVSSLLLKARVVVQPHGSEIEKAFAVKGYPSFALVGADGVVTVSGDLEEVATAAKAAV
jgi:hypothetical protein